MNLIIVAYWTDDDHDTATDYVAEALRGHAISETGSVVSFSEGNVDRQLRSWLRALQLEEAANS